MTEGTRAPYDADDYYGDPDFSASPLARRKTRSHRKKSKKTRMARGYPRRKRKSSSSIPYRKRGRVKHTKNGQPYIILANGKARFIKRR